MNTNARSVLPLSDILDLLLEGKIKDGTQALYNHVQDMKAKRGRAGRSGSRESKQYAAKRRWEARQGRGSVHESPVVHESVNRANAMNAVPVVHAIQPARQVSASLPPGVMKGSELEGRGPI